MDSDISVKALLVEAEKTIKTKDFKSAVDTLEKVINTDPNHVTAHKLLQGFFFSVGNFEKACRHSDSILGVDPQNILAWKQRIEFHICRDENALAKLKLKQALAATEGNKSFDSLEHYLKHQQHNNPNEEELLKAVTLFSKRKYELLLEFCENLSIKYPRSHKVQNIFGSTYASIGLNDIAIKHWESAIAFKPNYIKAHRNLSLARKYEANDVHFIHLLKLLEFGDLKDDALCQLHFALAKAYDDIDDRENAFDTYCKANSHRKSLKQYDFQRDAKLFHIATDAISQCVNIASLDSIHDTGSTPIFILGMPRSGTSLLEQILSCHSNVKAGGELPYVNNLGRQMLMNPANINKNSIELFRNNYISLLQNEIGPKKFITDKMPQNFFFLPLLLKAFPDAPVLITKRSWQAVLWSNFKQYYVSEALDFSYDISDIREYQLCLERFINLCSSLFHDKIKIIDHETLLNNRVHTIKNILNFLGLSLEKACLFPENNSSMVTTASMFKVRDKIDQEANADWKRYRELLSQQHPMGPD